MKTHQLLEISQLYYDEIVLKTFINWCMLYVSAPKALQMALTSKGLQNYFKVHYNALEKQFESEINSFESVSKEDKNEFYAEVTNAIFKNYPSALLPKLNATERILTNFN
ncbi:hypothetical protein [Flavobacterium sp. HSC-61S13]|uniref:hypothetical protein n=1 Tax=Flavobacterium sp. HSC-61S13 TaxID=2910963 RepID=UPI0020A19287|nr:hypothetical protein [Flavobacterium sp. HSC-61S13]MCP1997274.1 hypothetical protein [Flavobacterium sp. HSC-61S13]